MNTRAVPLVAADRPIFVLGEKAPAVQLVQALGQVPTLCAMPPSRLLSELVFAAERCARLLGPWGLAPEGLRPASWYGEVQAAQLQATGKIRTVEFSALSVLRILTLFPGAQIIVVRRLKRAMPPSRRVPPLAASRIMQVDSEHPASPETLERVLAFVGEPAEPIELDLSDQPQRAPTISS